MVSLSRRMAAETLGTAWLVLGGCGTAVLASHNVGWLGVSLAFGLTVVSMAYAIGHVSGCHLNPAVTLGLAAARRFPAKEILFYWAAQVGGALIGAALLSLIAHGVDGFKPGGFASNGYGEHSPGKYSLVACLVTEVVFTFVFLMVILGATHRRASAGFAGLAIGLCLTLIHLISIPVTNTSVNPARSTGPALFADAWAVGQLWMFWVAPLVGAFLAGLLYPILAPNEGNGD